MQLRQRAAIESAHRRPHPAAQRSRGVAAEVVMVHVINRIDQELELDVELPSRGFCAAYFGIHTRTNDSNFSTSRGLAM